MTRAPWFTANDNINNKKYKQHPVEEQINVHNQVELLKSFVQAFMANNDTISAVLSGW